jgi:hypothetical protein
VQFISNEELNVLAGNSFTILPASGVDIPVLRRRNDNIVLLQNLIIRLKLSSEHGDLSADMLESFA